MSIKTLIHSTKPKGLLVLKINIPSTLQKKCRKDPKIRQQRYNSRGNLLEDESGQEYVWDLDNRIASIDPNTTTDDINYQYDAFSRRVHRQQQFTTEVLLWWGKEEYAEHEDSASGPTIQNDLHSSPKRGNTVFGRALEGDRNDIQYFHKNYLNHVYAVSDDRGGFIEHYRYTTFGEPEFYNESGEEIAGSEIDNDILWNVKRYSEASGLYMYLYRHYEAEHGRWSSRDPITEQGGVNLYAFVGNQAIMTIDIHGLEPEVWDFIGCLIEAGAELALEQFLDSDLFVFGEADLAIFGGVNVAVGIVVDFENPSQSGLFVSGGVSGGASYGYGGGIGLVDEVEGQSMELDINAAVGGVTISSQVNDDPNTEELETSFNGIAITAGPGLGSTVGPTHTSTLSVENIANAWNSFTNLF